MRFYKMPRRINTAIVIVLLYAGSIGTVGTGGYTLHRATNRLEQNVTRRLDGLEQNVTLRLDGLEQNVTGLERDLTEGLNQLKRDLRGVSDRLEQLRTYHTYKTEQD